MRELFDETDPLKLKELVLPDGRVDKTTVEC